MSKNLMARAEVVKAMDTMVGCINDEGIIESWLVGGVADGDITEDTTLEDIIEMGYCDGDETFRDLLTLFLRLMNRASKDGLYSDGVVSYTKHIEWV